MPLACIGVVMPAPCSCQWTQDILLCSTILYGGACCIAAYMQIGMQACWATAKWCLFNIKVSWLIKHMACMYMSWQPACYHSKGFPIMTCCMPVWELHKAGIEMYCYLKWDGIKHWMLHFKWTWKALHLKVCKCPNPWICMVCTHDMYDHSVCCVCIMQIQACLYEQHHIWLIYGSLLL